MTQKPFKNSRLIQKDMYKGTKQVQPPLNASHLIHIYQKYIFFFPDMLLEEYVKKKRFLKYLKAHPPFPPKGEKRTGFVDAYE